MDAVHIKNCVLAAFAAVGTVAAQALGGWDAAMQVLVALMAADYLTGVLVAAVWQRSRKTESGALDSKAGYIGLLKKGMILLVVWLGVLLDNALGETYIRMAVVLFFVGNEGLSLLENAAHIGLPIPDKMKDVLAQLHGREDTKDGEQ